MGAVTRSRRRPQRSAALVLLATLATACLGLTPALTQNVIRPRRAESEVKTAARRVGPNLRSAEPQRFEKGEAQKPQREPPASAARYIDQDQDDEVVRVEAAEVLLPVTVRDASGVLVTGLGREDFRVFEDGLEQRLSDLALRETPVDAALLVDSSSSVAASFEDFRHAAREFARRLGSEDRFCLVKFDDRVELLLDWTRSEAQLGRALGRLSAGVFTRFNDALALTSREQFPRNRRRHALVVLSDGVDSNRGQFTLEDSLRSLLESQVAVYVISNTEVERARKRAELDSLLSGGTSAVKFNGLRIGDLRESLRVLDRSEQNLERLAQATGGRLYKPTDFSSLDRVYNEIAEELRQQYALYYTPANTARDGRFRRTRVEIAGRDYVVSTRTGYFAPR